MEIKNTKSRITFIQRNCREGNKVDPRQARAVIKYKPNIIILERPQGEHDPKTIFNQYSLDKKPLAELDTIIKNLKESSKKYPYAASDIILWNNIKKLWYQEINTKIYHVDAPSKLRQQFTIFKGSYQIQAKNWLFWVFLYLRENYMARNIKNILKSLPKKEKITILVCLQSIHWQNVKFLLTNPSKDKIFKYYFGKFKNITVKNIGSLIKENNNIFYFYWRKIH